MDGKQVLLKQACTGEKNNLNSEDCIKNERPFGKKHHSIGSDDGECGVALSLPQHADTPAMREIFSSLFLFFSALSYC